MSHISQASTWNLEGVFDMREPYPAQRWHIVYSPRKAARLRDAELCARGFSAQLRCADTRSKLLRSHVGIWIPSWLSLETLSQSLCFKASGAAHLLIRLMKSPTEKPKGGSILEHALGTWNANIVKSEAPILRVTRENKVHFVEHSWYVTGPDRAEGPGLVRTA